MSINDSLDKVSGSMPDVQQHAVEAEKAMDNERREASQGLTDKKGRPFDPNIHKTDASGNPMTNSDGSLRIKPGWGSPTFNKSSKPVNSRLNVDAPQSPPMSGPMMARQTGQQIANTIFAVGQAMGGEEWAPVKNDALGIDEYTAMCQAWGRYCEATGMNDIPPGIALTITMVAYVGPRFAQPKTKKRATTAFQWLKSKYIRFQLRRRGIDPDTINGEKDDKEDGKKSEKA